MVSDIQSTDTDILRTRYTATKRSYRMETKGNGSNAVTHKNGIPISIHITDTKCFVVLII